MCKEKNVRLFVTNPAFEFWLLLHTAKVFEYNPEEILSNQKTGSKRFLEKALSEVFEGYRKDRIRVERFIPHIQIAITNEKEFCEDILELKEKLGSNVGKLLDECILS